MACRDIWKYSIKMDIKQIPYEDVERIYVDYIEQTGVAANSVRFWSGTLTILMSSSVHPLKCLDNVGRATGYGLKHRGVGV
jgi:hypothetical protein